MLFEPWQVDMQLQEPAVSYRDSCHVRSGYTGPRASGPVQVFLGCDLMRGLNGVDESSSPDKRQCSNSSSPTLSENGDDHILILDEWLDKIRSRVDAHGIDFMTLKLKFAAPSIDLLDASLTILNGLPCDML